MAIGRRPTTDTGTVVTHVMLVSAFIVLLATGLRIASDDPAAPSLAVLDPVLPVEALWYRHLVAAFILVATLAGYVIYMRRARLLNRVSLDAARLRSLAKGGRTRWMAISALVYWSLMAALLVEVVSGVALFVEMDGPWLSLHRRATWMLIAIVMAHIASHAGIGGARQILRIARPAPLVVPPPTPDVAELLARQLAGKPATEASIGGAESAARRFGRRVHPLVPALGVAFIALIAAAGFEIETRPVLHIVEIAPSEAPAIDGDISDAVWRKAPAVRIVTTQGGDFGGTGVSVVDVRAVHDGTFAYFAFVWTDPTRSLKHRPLLKTERGWEILRSDDDERSEAIFNEDKFSVLLSKPVFPLIGAAIHLSPAPLSGHPPSGTGRGLHYTPDGSIADVWVWRASHAGPGGFIDNAHFGGAAPSEESDASRSGYAGGFALDPGRRPYRANIATAAAGTTMLPERLPRDLSASAAALGRFAVVADFSEAPGSRWWMTEAESVPYSAGRDALIAVGTVIPGIVVDDAPKVDSTSIRGVARWASGRWTLEVVRRLYTASPYDLPIKSGTLMWVAVFDHAETRHSRHLRPLRLELE